MIQRERVKALNAEPGVRGAYVLYWMQASVGLEHRVRAGRERRQRIHRYRLVPGETRPAVGGERPPFGKVEALERSSTGC